MRRFIFMRDYDVHPSRWHRYRVAGPSSSSVVNEELPEQVEESSSDGSFERVPGPSSLSVVNEELPEEVKESSSDGEFEIID